ncbi:MAG: DNA mismatch repair protein MutT [Desulfuromonas sp.]|nr:MAG: DNA mismatch repair protein MutT [Desulfuromonas sp.]
MDFKKQGIKTCVVACIIDDQNRVLLTRRCIEPFCSQWVMPGGKIDKGESILEALHREVCEEVGIEIHAEKLIDVFEHIGIGKSDDHYVILYYRCTPAGGDLIPNGSECTEAIWVRHNELSGMELPPGCRHILGMVYPDLEWDIELRQEDDIAAELPGPH